MPSSSCENIYVDNAIDNTVTAEDVTTVLQLYANDSSVQVLNYELYPYSNYRLGFFGSHRQLKITFKRNDNEKKETVYLFVKSMPYESESQVLSIRESGIFFEEYTFFHEIVDLLLDNYKGEKWSPMCYLAKPDSLIIEDLKNENFKMRTSFFDSYTEVKSVFAAIARLHGCSFTAEFRLKRFSKYPVTFKDYFPNSFREKVFRLEGQTSIWFSASIKLACTIGASIGCDSHKLRKSYKQLLKIIKPSNIYRNVICHGDLWTNNVMFDDSKPLPRCVLVDYQTLRYAPQALDIAQLLYMHTSREFRNKYENELIEYYYSVFEKTVKESNPVEVNIPSLTEIIDSLRDLRVFGPAVASLYFPITLLDPKILQEKTKNADEYNKFLFGDRTNITRSYMLKNDEYREKLEEVISELEILSDNF